MKAALLTHYGQPPRRSDAPDPEVAEGQVLVEVEAAPISPLDVFLASGSSYFGAPPLPYVPGVQGVGLVRGGSGLGRRVWFQTGAGIRPGENGAMAELVAVPPEGLVEVPEAVGSAAAAALGLSAVAAWEALSGRARLQPGERVLVLGASGAVGQVALQAARILGAGYVAGTARSPEGREAVMSRGADAAVDPTGEDVGELAGRFEAACGGPVDVVIDPIFGLAASAALRALGPGGRLVQLGSAAAETATFDSATIRGRSLSILGYTNASLGAAETSAALGTVLGHAAAGRIGLAFDTAPLAEVEQAWRRQQEGKATSRVVLVP